MKYLKKIVAAFFCAVLLFSCQKKSAESKNAKSEPIVSQPPKSESDEIKKVFQEIPKGVPSGTIEKTGGFFDCAELSYPKNVIVIDDELYPDKKKKREAFTNAISSGSVDSSKLSEDEALILLFGTVDLSDGNVSDSDHSYFDEFDSETHKKVHADFVYEVGSNKTILGIENAKIAFGGLRIKARPTNTANNIVIRNVEFWDAHGSTDFDTLIPEFKDKKAGSDQISVEGTYAKGEYVSEFIPENIWIDHCSFSDGVCVDLDRNFNHDGAIDVKAVHNMTISWCDFSNHDKVTLIGSGDKFTESKDRQITFHHNYYHGTVQRMPRSRGCQVHLYNNVYENIGTEKNHGYSLGPGIGSLFIVEGNTFGSHKGKILRYADSSKPEDETFSKLFVNKNNPELDSKNSEQFELHAVNEKPFLIPYEYDLLSAEESATLVKAQAGATLKYNVR